MHSTTDPSTSDLNPQSVRAWSDRDAADRYERTRPPYAEESVRHVVDVFGLGPQSRVLDLGAGTGKLTRQLLPHVGEAVAVEPLESMRQALHAAVPDARVLAGSAEAVPLESGTVDAVVAGQAWHWFDSAHALSEVARVGRENVGLALFWNEYDDRSPLMRDFAKIRDSYGTPPDPETDQWRSAFQAAQGWEPLQKAGFYHSMSLSLDGFAERMFTASWMAVLPEDEKDRVRTLIRELVDSHNPAGTGPEHVDLAYVTEVFWTRRIGSA